MASCPTTAVRGKARGAGLVAVGIGITQAIDSFSLTRDRTLLTINN